MSDKLIRPDVIGGYQMMPKSASDGAGRINPMRASGESEVRSTISRMNHARLLDSNQLQQVLAPRGHITDIDSSIFGPEHFAERHGYSPDTFAPPNGQEVGVGSFGELLASFESTSAEKAMLYNRQQLREGNEEHSRKLLSDSEYFNRKLALTGGNADFDGNELNDTPPEPERLVPRFIFEPNTILSQAIENITVKLRLPYTKCSFIQQQSVAGYAEVAMNDMTDEINAIELSATKILFMCILRGRDYMVQVNQFRNKDDDTKVFYKAFLAQGPDVLLPPESPEHRFKDEVFAYIAPIYAFLEGLAVGVYSLKREGARDISDRTPAPAKDGIMYKVLRMIPDRPAQEYIPKGGTHASPREHERRAYTRMGRNGKVQHIPATTVNKGKTPGGLVIKDYNIKDPKK
jgi:hypothetical protein